MVFQKYNIHNQTQIIKQLYAYLISLSSIAVVFVG